MAGLLLLGAAYGVYEEGLVDRFWYDPGYWAETGVDGYSVVWHVNVLLAAHLTVFRTAVSIVAAIVVVERLFPAQRAQSWIGRVGMAACGITVAGVLFVSWEEFYVPPLPVLLPAAVLCVLLVLAACRVGRRAAAASWPNPRSHTAPARVGLIAFVNRPGFGEARFCRMVLGEVGYLTVEPVEGRGRGVVVAVARGPDRRDGAGLGEAFGVADRQVLPGSECTIVPTGRRRATAGAARRPRAGRSSGRPSSTRRSGSCRHP